MKNQKWFIGIILTLSLIGWVIGYISQFNHENLTLNILESTNVNSTENIMSLDQNLKVTDPITVACVFSIGGLGDHSFNDMVYTSLQKAQTEGLCTFIYSEPSDITQYEVLLKNHASVGYDLIVAVGWDQTTAVNNTALSFPTQAILLLDGTSDQGNVRSVLFKTNEVSFLGGALAALMTRTGRLGFIGGMDVPIIREFYTGYVAGAYYERNDSYIEVFDDFVGGWNDPPTAKALAEAMWREGVDIIFAAAGKSGLGVLESSNETRGVYSIGVDGDQDYLYPGHVLTSIIKRYDLAVYNAIKDIYDANWSSGTKLLGLADNGVSLSPFKHTRKLIDTEILNEINDTLRTKILNEEILVPNSSSSLSQWKSGLNIINKSYNHYPQISITSDTELGLLFNGSGSYSDPYQIEGLYINETSGTQISISNTSSYLRISDCLINGYGTLDAGIFLSNVSNSRVEYNALVWCGGIRLKSCTKNNVSKNSVFNCDYGIHLASSNKSFISMNSISDNRNNGIKLVSSSQNNTLTQNRVYRNGLYSLNLEIGILLYDYSYNNTISNNIIYSNGHQGIWVGLFGGGNCNTKILGNIIYDNNWGISVCAAEMGKTITHIVISNNEVFNNKWWGITTEDSANYLMMNNTVYNNYDGGILMACDESTVMYNIVYGNEGPQINCHGSNNSISMNDFAGTYQYLGTDYGTNNTIIDNYWSNWDGTGSYGFPPLTVGNEDPSPLKNPFHLTAPSIVYPDNNVLTLKGTVNIQWNSSIDLLAHPIYYNLSYSDNAGESWIELISGLTLTNYTWDVSSIYDQTVILLKIQASDNVGFTSTFISPNNYTIENPMLTTTTATTTFATTTTTSETSTSEPPTSLTSETLTLSRITSNASLSVVVLSVVILFLVRRKKTKAS